MLVRLNNASNLGFSPSVFPSNAHLVKALCAYLKMPEPQAPAGPQSTLYTSEGTRMGIW